MSENLVPKLRFREFHDEWSENILSNICEINPRTEVPEKFNYIDLESVNSGFLTQTQEINREEAPSRAQRKLNKNDILFATVRPYQQNNYYFNLDGDYVASTGYAQIRSLENPEYLYYFIHTKKFLNDVLKRCTGTSYPAINSNDLKTIKIKKPNISEQEKISSFLSKFDKKMELLEKKYHDFQEFKKYLLQNIFSQKLRFKGFEDEWKYISAGEIFKNVTNKNHDGTLPILAVTQDKGVVYRDSLDMEIKTSQNSVKTYKLIEPGDFVISLRSFQGGIEYSYIEGICSPAYTILKPKLRFVMVFINFILKKMNSFQG